MGRGCGLPGRAMPSGLKRQEEQGGWGQGPGRQGQRRVPGSSGGLPWKPGTQTELCPIIDFPGYFGPVYSPVRNSPYRQQLQPVSKPRGWAGRGGSVRSCPAPAICRGPG